MIVSKHERYDLQRRKSQAPLLIYVELLFRFYDLFFGAGPFFDLRRSQPVWIGGPDDMSKHVSASTMLI